MKASSYNKTALDFHDSNRIQWSPVEGYSHGVYERILSRDETTGDNTRLVYFEPGVETKETLVHDFWEEVFIIKGGLIDLSRNEAFSEGYYACRPPGTRHGPYSMPVGYLAFEVRYFR